MKKNHSMPFLLSKKYIKALLIGMLTFPSSPILAETTTPEISFFEQSYSLKLKFNNETLGNAIEKLSQQANVRIIYSNDQVQTQKRISANIQTTDIQEALRIILGNGYVFKQENNYISIAKAKNSETFEIAEQLQQKKHSVTGLLTDADGNPIIGATIAIKGTTHGVTTDVDGRYILNNVNEGDVIEYRYIGYNTEEKTYKGEESINIRMVESSVGLEDVVVIGYGQQKKESVVSSINTISAKELSMPTRSLSNNIAGQIAGVLAVQRTGEPGKDNSEFWIRGISSFAGGTSPLVLVDGVPRSMNDITVDEIESFTVLKDASATAVYGAEGANGVVLITSKRGSSQKPTLDVRAEFGIAKPTRLPNLANSYEFAQLYNEAAWEVAGAPASGFINPYSDHDLEMYRTGEDPDLYPNTDFLSLLKDQTFNQRVSLNLRGGGDKVRYFVSGSFYHEDGMFNSQSIEDYNANIGLSRYNIRSNIDIDVTKTTLLAVDISGQYTDSHNPAVETQTIFNNIFNYAPNQFPLRFSDGTFSEYRLYNGGTGNPYNMLNESGYTDGWYANLQSKLTLTQKLDFITEGLNIKLSGSFDADYNSKTKRTKTPTSYMMQLNDAGEKEYIQINEGAPNLTDHSEASKGGEKRVYLEASLNYKRIFNNVHDVSGLLLYMQKERQTQGSGLPYKKQSIVARGSYGYDNRYMLEGSFGLTGSENFAEGHRYGIFPAVGVAWYASNEKFMKGTEDIINKLKIRASYGITGNDNVGGTRFPYRGSLKTDAGGYNFGFNVGANGGGTNDQGKGIIENLFAAPFLSWEIEEKKNIGFDLGLLRGRIDMSVDFFKNDRRDILMQRKTVSAVTGFRQSPWQNFGKVTNKGLDGNIVVKQSINNVNISFRGNFTYAKNKIMEYDEVSPRYEYQRYTGQSLKTPLLYIADGLYTADDFIITENPENGSKSYSLKEGLPVPSAAVSPGDIKYLDLNGDGKIDSYDQTYNHKFYAENPELVYGFGLNAEYKGFYAGIFFQGVAKASMNLNGSRDFVPFSFGQLGSLRREGFDHWSSRNPENQDVLFPRLHTEEFSHNKLNSTWWYRDASFLRLKNIELGYTFNKEMLRKMAIQNARIYVQGNNIAVWDHIGMWDPELGSARSGIKYPINMTWTLGVEFGF